MLNLSDKSKSNVTNSDMSYVNDVATFGDKLYYTNYDTHTVTCVIYMEQHSGNSKIDVFYRFHVVSL